MPSRPAQGEAPYACAQSIEGAEQIAGADAEFGTVYSLKDGFNFEILSVRYTVEPVAAHETRAAQADKKLVVLDVAIKNARPSDNYYNPDASLTLVDAQGELYPNRIGDMVLASQSDKEAGWTLRHSSGKVVRCFVAGATEAEAGKAGDPRNVIAPLPENARDPSDPSGASALGSGKGTAGVFLPTGAFALGKAPVAPGDGKKYAVATITVKSLTPKPQTIHDFTDRPSGACTLTDPDGETDNCVGYIKARSNERPEHDFNPWGIHLPPRLPPGQRRDRQDIGPWGG